MGSILSKVFGSSVDLFAINHDKEEKELASRFENEVKYLEELKKLQTDGSLTSPKTKIITPLDGEAYHEARIAAWNKDAVGLPYVIAYAGSVEDLCVLLKFAKENTVKLGISGGCHSHCCRISSSFTIDLSLLNEVKLNLSTDPEVPSTVEVGGGAKLGSVDEVLAPHKLGFPTGTNPDTGVGGLTLSGGWGWLARKYGLSVDNLIKCQLVTIDGEILEVTDKAPDNGDLLWALKGGGGNFGVVTSFTFKVHKVSDPLVAETVYFAPTLGSARGILEKYFKWVETADKRIGTALVIPVGAPVIVTLQAAFGDENEKIVKASDVPTFAEGLRLGGWFAIKRAVQVMPYNLGLQRKLEEVQQTSAQYDCGFSISKVDTDFINAVLHFARVNPCPSGKAIMILAPFNGAISEVDPMSTAASYRNYPLWLLVEATIVKPSDRDPCIQWVKKLKARLEELKIYKETSHAPPIEKNPDDNPMDQTAKQAFPDQTLERLQVMKNKYDPMNMFSLNKNIKPSSCEQI